MKKLLAYLMIIVCLMLPGTVPTAGANDTVYYSHAAEQLRRHSFSMEVLVSTDQEIVIDQSDQSIVLQLQTTMWHGIGSGTLVEINGEPNVLTAWHVAEYAIDQEMRACPVLEPKSKCVSLTYPWMFDMANTGPGGDWALFQLLKAPSGMKPAKMRRAPMIVGEPIRIMASPGLNEGLLTQGIVSGFDTVGDTNLIKSDAFVFYGSSGGGLYDRKGRLLGVVIAIGKQRDIPLAHVNVSVPVYSIRQFLKENS